MSEIRSVLLELINTYPITDVLIVIAEIEEEQENKQLINNYFLDD